MFSYLRALYAIIPAFFAYRDAYTLFECFWHSDPYNFLQFFR